MVRLFLLLCVVSAVLPSGAAEKEVEPSLYRKERDLLTQIERIQGEQGTFSVASVDPMYQLGLLYVSSDRCEDAVAILTKALGVSRATEGLFNLQQLELLDPLLECYLALDLQREFDRELQYLLLMGEQKHGPDDPQILPAIDRAARWYEQSGRYISARKLHTRAIRIAGKAGGKMDLRMVDALRGIARAYRLEYVHGVREIDIEEYPISPLRSKATFVEPYIRLDRLGGNSLERAVKILRQHPDADRAQLIDTLIDFGDWHQMENARREALADYKAAWTESMAPGYESRALFTEPVPIFYRTATGVALRRPPPPREGYRHCWVDFEFTVTREGRVKDVKVVGSDAPRREQIRLAEDLERSKYRPRFVAGEPVDTLKFRLRQGLYVEARD